MSIEQNQISTLLQFAHLQMASEAFFGLQKALPDWDKSNTDGFNIQFDDLIEPSFLTRGNEHASKFSPTQAAQFASNWKTVAHIANTTTGFSGTLFEAKDDIPEAGITKGDRVLSFRSTEFIEDAVHDNRSTNTFEIKQKGFAFGQIADMGFRHQTTGISYRLRKQ